jgi:hypothetical protein
VSLSPDIGLDSGAGIKIGTGLSIPPGIYQPPEVTGAHPLASLFGTTDKGYLIDGVYSTFTTDSAGTTPCVTSGSDPVGYVEDVSGKGNHVVQATSNNKPVYIEHGTIKTFQGGFSTLQRRWLEATVTERMPNAFSMFVVSKMPASGLSVHNLVMLYGVAPFYQFYTPAGATVSVDMFADAASATADSGVGTDRGYGFGYIRNSLDAGDAKVSCATSDALTAPAGLFSQALSAGGAGVHELGGWSGSDYLTHDMAFCLFIDRALTAGEVTTVLAYMNTTFGGL